MGIFQEQPRRSYFIKGFRFSEGDVTVESSGRQNNCVIVMHRVTHYCHREPNADNRRQHDEDGTGFNATWQRDCAVAIFEIRFVRKPLRLLEIGILFQVSFVV